MARISILDLQRMKSDKQKIVMMTAYDFQMARILDRVGLEMMLVGDSGARKHKHFQFLTDDHGVPELREHLTKVMTVADLAISMHYDFDQMLDRVLPRYGDTIELPFSDESAAASVRT